eukprot:237292-Prymnesium_polylepis.1
MHCSASSRTLLRPASQPMLLRPASQPALHSGSMYGPIVTPIPIRRVVTPGPAFYSPERFNCAIKHHPRRLAKSSEKLSSINWGARGAPPSIPVPDQAWGYEMQDGALVLQNPDAPLCAPGPGSYNPQQSYTKRAAVTVGFGAGSGRRIPVPELTVAPSVAEEPGPGDHDGQTANPKPYTPVPSANHPPRLYSSQRERPLYSQTSETPSNELDPGPGIYEVAPGVGRSRPIGTFPVQSKYQVRQQHLKMSVALGRPGIMRSSSRLPAIGLDALRVHTAERSSRWPDGHHPPRKA